MKPDPQPGEFARSAAKTFGLDASMMPETFEADHAVAAGLAAHLVKSAMGDLIALDRADQWDRYSQLCLLSPLAAAELGLSLQYSSAHARYGSASAWGEAVRVVDDAISPLPLGYSSVWQPANKALELLMRGAHLCFSKSWYVSLPILPIMCGGGILGSYVGEAPEAVITALGFALGSSLGTALLSGLFLIFTTVCAKLAGTAEEEGQPHPAHSTAPDMSLSAAIRLSVAFAAIGSAVAIALGVDKVVLLAVTLSLAGALTATVMRTARAAADRHESRVRLIRLILEHHRRASARAASNPFVALSMAGAGLPTDQNDGRAQVCGILRDVRRNHDRE